VNRANRGSKISSVNTEDSDQSMDSKYHEEHGDVLGALSNIQKQTKLMRKLNTSQLNLKSISLSETATGANNLCCSSNDISEADISTIPNTVKFEGLPVLNNQNNEENVLELIKVVPNTQPPKQENNEQVLVTTSSGQCHCYTEAFDSEQKVSFLCFKWRKKKQGMTVHNCMNK
jgi:hypothetical protein